MNIVLLLARQKKKMKMSHVDLNKSERLKWDQISELQPLLRTWNQEWIKEAISVDIPQRYV